MIQANELRRGNWVNVTHVHFKETEIDTIKIDDLVRIFTNVPTYDYTPIPITEEWLLNFGFEISKEGWFGYAEKNKLKFDISSLSEEIVLQDYGGKRVAIKYVHQLQNLYFFMLSEELTLSVT